MTFLGSWTSYVLTQGSQPGELGRSWIASSDLAYERMSITSLEASNQG